MSSSLSLLRSLQFAHPVEVCQFLSKSSCIMIGLAQSFCNHSACFEGRRAFLQVWIFCVHPVIFDPKFIELFQRIQFKGVFDEFLRFCDTTTRAFPPFIQLPFLTLQRLQDLLTLHFVSYKILCQTTCLYVQPFHPLVWRFRGRLARSVRVDS